MDLHIGAVPEPPNALGFREMLKRIEHDGIVELTEESGMYILMWKKNINSTVQVAIPGSWLDDPQQFEELKHVATYFAENAFASPLNTPVLIANAAASRVTAAS
jgi:hypothetical protein